MTKTNKYSVFEDDSKQRSVALWLRIKQFDNVTTSKVSEILEIALAPKILAISKMLFLKLL